MGMAAEHPVLWASSFNATFVCPTVLLVRNMLSLRIRLRKDSNSSLIAQPGT